MRIRAFCAPSLVSLMLLACDAKPLAGPQVEPVALVGAHPGETGPLIFVDGHRLLPGQSLGELPASRIALIEVIKGPAAKKLYGPEGAMGVIEIHTKTDQRQR